MNAGRFRSDLYFRIAQVRVELPPLRERPGDIAPLVDAVCKRAARRSTPGGRRWIEQNLATHDWPGNVRELVNVASVAATLADTPGAIDDVLALTRDHSPTRRRAPITAFAEAKRLGARRLRARLLRRAERRPRRATSARWRARAAWSGTTCARTCASTRSPRRSDGRGHPQCAVCVPLAETHERPILE